MCGLKIWRAFSKKMQFWEKRWDDRATFTGPLLCVLTVGSARPHLFRNSHLIPHPRYSSDPFEWMLYRGSFTSGLAFWKSFVISFPDFRNRFTCVAGGNGKVDTLWIYYPTVGMPDISRFIVTLLYTGLFQTLPQFAFEYSRKKEEFALLHLIHAINSLWV